MKVLIAEIESKIIHELKYMLTNLEHEVVGVVSTGEEAKNQASKLSPDLLLINIKLGEEMTGVEAGRIVKDLYKIPAIYITVFTKNCLTKSLQLPDDAVTLSIPLRQDHLKYAISRLFPG